MHVKLAVIKIARDGFLRHGNSCRRHAPTPEDRYEKAEHVYRYIGVFLLRGVFFVEAASNLLMSVTFFDADLSILLFQFSQLFFPSLQKSKTILSASIVSMVRNFTSNKLSNC